MGRHKRGKVPSPYKSWYEYWVSLELTNAGVKFEYEAYQFTYYPTISKGVCLDCESTNVSRAAVYTPDWYLPDYDFYIETKGILSATERKKLQTVKAQTDIDLRVMIESDGKIRGTKKWSRYSDWLEWAGFTYAVGKKVPIEWIQ